MSSVKNNIVDMLNIRKLESRGTSPLVKHQERHRKPLCAHDNTCVGKRNQIYTFSFL